MNRYAEITYQEVVELRKRIISNHIQAGQRASGRTIDSMVVERDADFVTLYGRKAFGTLETGRKGGKVPKGFYAIILRWVQDKGISVDKPRTFAWFVAQKIAREGTALFRAGGRSDIYSNEISRTMDILVKRFGEEAVQEIDHIILNKAVFA